MKVVYGQFLDLEVDWRGYSSSGIADFLAMPPEVQALRWKLTAIKHDAEKCLRVIRDGYHSLAMIGGVAEITGPRRVEEQGLRVDQKVRTAFLTFHQRLEDAVTVIDQLPAPRNRHMEGCK